jgi:hypothetical protein
MADKPRVRSWVRLGWLGATPSDRLFIICSSRFMEAHDITANRIHMGRC